MKKGIYLVLIQVLIAGLALGQPVKPSPLAAAIDRKAAAIEKTMIEWRRWLHAHPELSNREAATSQFVAEKLRSFGLEVQTGIARYGVVGVLKGGKPGPVIAMRADMDALPVTEPAGLPFASTATAQYRGNTVGVMHACGHDAHMAMLLAVAQIFSELRGQLPGTVKFIFQPAEEGSLPEDGLSGAAAMVAAGVLESPHVAAVFGAHVFADLPAGVVAYRPGPVMASSDIVDITVQGRQTHGAMPWGGIDPVVVGSQIVLGLQTIVSRQVEITKEPAIVTVAVFQAGVRGNIIPDSARLSGTIRTFDEGMQADIHLRVKRTVEGIAAAAGTTARVSITRGYPVTVNNVALTERMAPTLRRVLGADNVRLADKKTGAEDFAFYARQVPALFLFVGVTDPAADMSRVGGNHSQQFVIDERGLLPGLRALCHVAADYLANTPAAK